MRTTSSVFKQAVIVLAYLAMGTAVVLSPVHSLAEKPESIGVAVISDHSGPFRGMAGSFSLGAEDAAKHLNSSQGGIDGVKINLIVTDSKGHPELGLRQYSEIMAEKSKPLFISGTYSGIAVHLRDKVNKDGLIGFFPSSRQALYPPGNAYGYFADYVDQALIAVKWIKDNFKEARNPRVAIMTWDNEYGKAPLVPEFFDYCRKIGVDIVAQELFGVKEEDLSMHAIRIRAKHPDWILSNSALSGPVAIMKALKKLGMDTKMINGIGSDPVSLAAAPELFEDCVCILATVSLDNDQHPGIKKIREMRQTYNRDAGSLSCYYIHGWEFILMIEKVIKEAIAKVGWDKLDVTALREEMNRLTDWEPLDRIVRVTYTDKDRSSPWMVLYKMKSGKLVPAGGVGGDEDFIRAPELGPK